MIQSSVSLWLVPTTRAQAMSAPDDEVDGVRSCFHAGREPTSWFCIRRSTPRQPESWHNKASRASWAGIWAPALRTRPGMIHALPTHSVQTKEHSTQTRGAGPNEGREGARTAWSLPQVVCGMTGTKSFWNMAARDRHKTLNERTDRQSTQRRLADARGGFGRLMRCCASVEAVLRRGMPERMHLSFVLFKEQNK